MNRKIYKHKDNVRCQLNAGISASATTIPLKSGQGAQLPVTYGGNATSLGSSTLLNFTGIGASGVAVGDIIENVTDGSYAVITAVAANSVTTTRLKGGSDNTWQNADKWAVNRFVITLVHYDTDGETVLKREKVLIDSRSGDNLTVNASGRGFDSDTAQSFSADDYVFLFLTSAAMDGLGQGFSQLIQDIDRLISQGSGEVYAADGGGSDAYAITLVPAPAAYTSGQVFNFKANTANTGAASLNVNSLGAIAIKKNHDQDLEDNDIESGQIVTVAYDGTYFQMQSQIANVFASKPNIQKGELIYAADAGASDAYAVTLSPAPSAYTTGMVVNFKANTANTGAATLNVNGLGVKTIKKNYSNDLNDNDILSGQLVSVIYDGTNFQMLSPIANKINFYAGNPGITESGQLSSTQDLTVTVNCGFAAKLFEAELVIDVCTSSWGTSSSSWKTRASILVKGVIGSNLCWKETYYQDMNYPSQSPILNPYRDLGTSVNENYGSGTCSAPGTSTYSNYSTYHNVKLKSITVSGNNLIFTFTYTQGTQNGYVRYGARLLKASSN